MTYLTQNEHGEHAKHKSTFRKAAQKALFEWGREEGLEDLLQDLWVWFLERPATQAQFSEQDEPLNRTMAHRAALQILAEQALADDVFAGKTLYSTDAIKDALKGESSNKYLREILPTALERLDSRNESYAESIRERYDDETVPLGAEADRLRHAVKALTDETNVTYLTSNDSGVGSSAAPGRSRKAGRGRRDPTGDIAVGMTRQTRADALHVTPLPVLLAGAQALPVLEMPDGTRWRTQPEEVL